MFVVCYCRRLIHDVGRLFCYLMPIVDVRCCLSFVIVVFVI